MCSAWNGSTRNPTAPRSEGPGDGDHLVTWRVYVEGGIGGDNGPDKPDEPDDDPAIDPDVPTVDADGITITLTPTTGDM